MTALNEKSMLVALNISQWTARKHDRKVTQEVAHSHATTTDAGRYNKALIAKGALAEIQTIISEARGTHYARTLPWTDEGPRILSSIGYFDYMATMKHHAQKFETAALQFEADYSGYVEEARRRLNGMFNIDDYPAATEIAAKFGFNVNVTPLPAAGDFRVSLGNDEEARIRADIQDRMNESVKNAMADVWDRLYKAVEKMRERLTAYHVDPATQKTSGIFRDSLVENMRELVGLLPALNLTGDGHLDAMRVRLESTLCVESAETLRQDDDLRERTARQARDILADMAGYCGNVAQQGGYNQDAQRAA